MTISELVQRAFKEATDKGWHDPEKSPLEYHALIHSEISEATEAARSAFENPPIVFDRYSGKPDGELVELADAVIRIADYCGSMGWDLEYAIKAKMEFNKTRAHRHGGKKF